MPWSHRRARILPIRQLLVVYVLLAGCASTAQSPVGNTPSPALASMTPIPQPSPSAVSSSGPLTEYEIGVPLGPGTYTTRVFASPFEFTVPAGWKVFEDEPGQFGLAIVANDGPCICFWRDVRIMSAECREEPEPGVGPTAEAIATALSHRPGIEASELEAIELGGLGGVRLDVMIDPAWTKACPFSEGRPAVPTLVGSGLSTGVAWDVEAADRQRLYLLDLGPETGGTNVTINIDVCCRAAWQQRIDAVTPVIDSIVFAPVGS